MDPIAERYPESHEVAFSRPPGVAFAFRFGNEDGFVQRFFALHRDLVARELHGEARCFLAFAGTIGKQPAFLPEWSEEVRFDCYDISSNNKQKIKKFINEHNVSLIVFQGANLGEIDIKFFNKLGVRTLNTEDHSFDQELRQSYAKSILKFCLRRVLKRQLHDLHITNGGGQYDFHRSISYIPAKNLRIVRYGIDVNYYSPGDRLAACARLGLDPEVIWCMAAAQARPEKRVDLLIEAVRRAKDAKPHHRLGFFFVGGGFGGDRVLAEWKELAHRLPSAEDYHFFGPQRDMRPFYHAASMFIHGASKESFGLVLAEAMASGLPVIATRAHGPTEIIDKGSTGFLVERDDWDAFVKAILTYADCPRLRREHGERGRKKCLYQYTSDRQATEMANLIRPFLHQTSTRSPSR